MFISLVSKTFLKTQYAYFPLVRLCFFSVASISLKKFCGITESEKVSFLKQSLVLHLCDSIFAVIFNFATSTF